MAKEKTQAKKEKKTSKKWEKYKIEDDKVKKEGRMCSRCGSGIFMAKHKDRWACGKCGYMEKISS